MSKPENNEIWYQFFNNKNGFATTINYSNHLLNETHLFNYELNNYEFIELLNKLDPSCLIEDTEIILDSNESEGVESIVYANGFLEKDFLNILWFIKDCDNDLTLISQCKDLALLSSATRMIIAIINDIDITNWFKKFTKEDIHTVFKNALILGNYEVFGYEFKICLQSCINKNIIDKEDYFEIAVVHGFVLSNTYKNNVQKEIVPQVEKKEAIKPTILKKILNFCYNKNTNN